MTGRPRAMGEDGTATTEFVLVFPLFMACVLTFFEAGWIMVQSAMLDRGVEAAVRDLRVGTTASPTPNQIRSRICDYAAVLRDCENQLMIELTPIQNSSDYPADSADCIDRTGPNNPLNPQDDFDPGARSEVMFMRACVLFDPWFPGIGLGLQLPRESGGGVRMTATTAFVNEPD